MPPDGETPLSDSERSLIRQWLATGAASQAPEPTAAPPVHQHHVLPILLLRCATCHGPRMQQGGLDVRSRDALLQGGAQGPALTPGDPDGSLMIERIESQACPPRKLLLKYFVRRPPASEVELLREWIAAGAPEVDIAADVAGDEPDTLVTDRDRQHWAFQPPVARRGAESIDEFIQARLREEGLDFSPPADRDTLIRRAHLDLIGIPPSVEQWRRWRNASDPDWFAQLVDHLLESPHYGERWGRYWLDLAGYADSEGGVSSDPLRPVAWKYRDYVIQAFNQDKPYDRFLIEQLAGDELLDYQAASEVTEEMVEHLIATGFLRMGIDQTGSRTMNFVPERLGVINDALTVVGEGLMGLTIGCARCHSHKYDPLPQRDYYRLKAVFQGAFDEHDWLTFRNRALDVAVPERRKRAARVNPPLQTRLKKLQAKSRQAAAAVRTALLESHYPDQSPEDRAETMRALGIADNNRTQRQRTLVEMLQQVEVLADSDQPEPVRGALQTLAAIEREMDLVQRSMEPPLRIRALWDRGAPSPTYILLRGEHTKPGRLVGPGAPSVLTDGRTPFQVTPPFPNGTPKTGRRLAFARWLTEPDHPLTARVMVNRIWRHHFGTGLVKSLENFGIQGERPSHPELLDTLAVTFVAGNWSVKQLHRLMMNTRVYQQSSRIGPLQRQLDPQNRLLSRMTLRRMDAESLRDSLLFVTGRLDLSGGGPPDSVSTDLEGQVKANPTPDGRWRRSVYLQLRRTEIPTMLKTFDYPEMGPNCLTRSVSTVSPQALMLMNNRRVRELAGAMASRVERMAASASADAPEPEGSAVGDGRLVDAAYHLALTRPPSDLERRLGIETLGRLRVAWQSNSQAALETYCHTILNSAAFLYID